jgi:hypothetical protein
MGRAILAILCSVLFALTPINHHGKMEIHASQEWDAFTVQFKYLVSDDKYELAERMLNNRLPQMEQYVETLTLEQRQMWQTLVMPLTTGSSQDFKKDSERFIMFMEAVTDDDPDLFAEQALSEFRTDLENVFIPVDRISQKWERLEPTIQVFYPNVEIEDVTASILTLNLSDTIETRKTALIQIDDILEHTTSLNLDALLWTAFMIGGTIILTLSYVSIRKFKGGQATLPSRKSENS